MRIRLVLIMSMLLVTACSPEFLNKKKKPTTAAPGATTSILDRLKDFFRPVSGGTSVATSASYKLKGVSIGSVVNKEAASAGYKNKDAMTGVVKETN